MQNIWDDLVQYNSKLKEHLRTKKEMPTYAIFAKKSYKGVPSSSFIKCLIFQQHLKCLLRQTDPALQFCLRHTEKNAFEYLSDPSAQFDRPSSPA